MKSFDFYEFAGLLAPGAIALLAVHMAAPDLLSAPVGELSVGGLGVFTILAYVSGHLIQSVANLVEKVWWLFAGGLPSDWIRTARGRRLLSQAQIDALPRQIQKQLVLATAPDIDGMTKNAWYGYTRQIYAAVAAASRAGRIDTFNGNYGLNRGLGTAFLVIGTCIVVDQPEQWATGAVLLVLATAALTRMHRFGKHYARELFVQFLQLP